MTHVGYLIGGWGIVAVGSALYVAWVWRRGRLLAARVPEEKRFWMSTDDAGRIGES